MKCNSCHLWHIRPEDNYCSWCGTQTAAVEYLNGCESIAIPQKAIDESKSIIKRINNSIQVSKKEAEPILPSWMFCLELRNTGMVPLAVFGIKKTLFFPFDVKIEDDESPVVLPDQTVKMNFLCTVIDVIEAKHFSFELDFKRNIPGSIIEPLTFYATGEPSYKFNTNHKELENISKYKLPPLKIMIENTGATSLCAEFSDLSSTLIPLNENIGKNFIGILKKKIFEFPINIEPFQQQNNNECRLKVHISSLNQTNSVDHLLKTEDVVIKTTLLHPPQLNLFRQEKIQFVPVNPPAIDIGKVFTGQRKRIDTFYLANTGKEPFEIKHCYVSHSEYVRVLIDGFTSNQITPTKLNDRQEPQKNYQLVIIINAPLDAEDTPLNGTIIFESIRGETYSIHFTGTLENLPSYSGYIGVDFGTINSCIAYKDNYSSPAAVLESDRNEATFPSAIYFQNEDDYIFGQRAKEKLIPDPDNTVQAIKRNLHLDSVRSIHGRNYAPGDFIRIMIRELISIFQKIHQRQPQHLSVTVPASFSSEHRRIIYEAAKSVVPKLVDIFDEPTSSAVAYIQQNPGIFSKYDKNPCHLVVFDFGGGTLDISVLKVTQHEIAILSRRGDNRLGGMDFDFLVASDLSATIQKQYPDFATKIVTSNQVDFRQNYKETAYKRLRQNFYDEAEKIKIKLTESTKAPFSFNTLLNANGDDLRTSDGKSLVKIVDEYKREKFENIIKPKVFRSLQVLENALAAASVSKEEVEIVLLTGQISKIPYIRNLIKTFFPSSTEIPSIDEFDPKTCVSLGAVHLASILANPEGRGKIKGLNETSCRYGYLRSDGFKGSYFVEVIPDHYPYNGNQQNTIFTLPENGEINLHIYQNIGTNDDLSNNNLDITLIGDVFLKGKPDTTVALAWIIDETGVLRIFENGIELHIEQLAE